MDEAYRLPFALNPRLIVDLGANIGLTSLYLADQYPDSQIVAVEPDPANAALARSNLEANGVTATVVEAAAAERDGVGYFEAERDSNRGRRSEKGREVDLVSIPTLIDKSDYEEIDLLKIDIEGGEGLLFDEETTWLSQVKSIIIEVHPARVDYPGLVAKIERAGFRYIPAGSAWYGSMDCFVRE
jgi:FkbM family methyltransferase